MVRSRRCARVEKTLAFKVLLSSKIWIFLFSLYFENISTYYSPCKVLSQNSYGKSDYFNRNFRIRLAAITEFKNDRDELGRVGTSWAELAKRGSDVESQHNKTNVATFLCIGRGVRDRKIHFFDYKLQYAWSALCCWRLRQRKHRWIGNFHSHLF